MPLRILGNLARIGRLARRDSAAPNPNLLLNGGFWQAQRGTTFDATTTPTSDDGNYTLDRWAQLSDGADRCDITQETSVVPTGSYAAIKFDVETVGSPSEKFGIIQILEARDSAAIIGGVATLSFKARTTSGAVENLRAGIFSWSSTADSPTLDLVNAWSVEGTDITTIANWTLESPADVDFALSDTYQTFAIRNVSIDTASAANVAVFIWVDDTDLIATNVFYIADVKLEKGSDDTEFQNPTFGVDQLACKRFYERFTYDSASNEAIGNLPQFDATPDTFFGIFRYDVEKRTQPSITFTGFATFQVEHDASSPPVAVSIAAARIGRYGCRIAADFGVTTVTDGAGILTRDTTDTCNIEVDAEFN